MEYKKSVSESVSLKLYKVIQYTISQLRQKLEWLYHGEGVEEINDASEMDLEQKERFLNDMNSVIKDLIDKFGYTEKKAHKVVDCAVLNEIATCSRLCGKEEDYKTYQKNYEMLFVSLLVEEIFNEVKSTKNN